MNSCTLKNFAIRFGKSSRTERFILNMVVILCLLIPLELTAWSERLAFFDVFVVFWIAKLVVTKHPRSNTICEAILIGCKTLSPQLIAHLFDMELHFDYYVMPIGVVLLLVQHVQQVNSLTNSIDIIICVVFCANSVLLVAFYYFLFTWVEPFVQTDISNKLKRFFTFVGDENVYVCSICQEEMINGNHAVLINCGHGFHLTCYRSWNKSSCPNCRESTDMINVWNLELAKKYAAQCELAR